MRKYALCNILVLLTLYSCTPTKPFQYVYKMTKPQISESTKFEDDKVIFDFKMNETDVYFKLSNKTEKPLKIIWDEASLVNQGEAQKVIHKNVKFIDSEKSQSLTVIPPGAYVSEVIQPIDDINFDRKTYSWSKKSFLPPLGLSTNKKYVDNKLKPLIGRKFNIYIPVQFEEKTLEYYFEVEVSDIRHITKKSNVSIMAE